MVLCEKGVIFSEFALLCQKSHNSHFFLSLRWVTWSNSQLKTVRTNVDYPRVIKTHLPLEMLPPDLLNKCKVIFVGRSPKDCCVSYYHHYLNLSTLCKYNFKGTFPDFVQLFMTGMVGFGNYWTMLKVCTYSTYRLDYPVSIVVTTRYS